MVQRFPHETDSTELRDEQGPISTFPPRALDDKGRLIPLSPEERFARTNSAIRALNALNSLPDNDPPGIDEEIMRGMDNNRISGQKLFEGMY